MDIPQTFILELLRAGVEPARVLPHYDLNVACLPVSPSQHIGNVTISKLIGYERTNWLYFQNGH